MTKLIATFNGDVDLSNTIWFDSEVAALPKDEMNRVMKELVMEDPLSFIEDLKLFEVIEFRVRPE